jgi:hypothetical protein
MAREYPLLELELRRRWNRLGPWAPQFRVSPRLTRILRILSIAVTIACVFYYYTPQGRYFTRSFDYEYRDLLLGAFWITHFIICLLITIYAGGSIAGERERGSLEILLLTPLSSRQILLEKSLAVLRLLTPLIFPVVIISLCSGPILNEDVSVTYVIGATYLSALFFEMGVAICVSSFATTTRTAVVISLAISTLTNLLVYIYLAISLGETPYFTFSYIGNTEITTAGILVFLHLILGICCLMIAAGHLNHMRNQSASRGFDVLHNER